LEVYGRERLDRLMHEAIGILAPYVDAGSIRRVHRAFLVRPTIASGARVWKLAALTLWLRRRVR
jgi:hypothetical protein